MSLPELVERIESAIIPVAQARQAFIEARRRMNAARPEINATRAERELYDERYRADHEAERALWTAALKFAEVAPDLLAALRAPQQEEHT